MGKYECVAENSVGTEHSKATSLYVKVRRVSPQFSRQPERQYEVPMGGNLTLTCVAVGSPMPNVKWRKGETLELGGRLSVRTDINILNYSDGHSSRRRS